MGCACACVCEREWDRERESKSQFCDFFPPSKSLSLCYTWMNCNFILWNFEVFFFLYFKNKLYRGKIYNKEATILSVQIHECSFMSLFSWPKLFCHAPSFFFFFFEVFLKILVSADPFILQVPVAVIDKKMIMQSSFSQLCLLVSLIRL